MQRPPSKGYRDDPIACVYPRIYVGAACQLTRETANRLGITHVINCAGSSSTVEWFRDETPNRYVVLGAIDDVNANIMLWYPAFESAVFQFMRDPDFNNLYIHCECGINRSMFLCLAFVVDHFNIPFHIEYSSMLFQRPCCLTNPSFWNQVNDFSKSRAIKYGSAAK
jgi:hypothetical protein